MKPGLHMLTRDLNGDRADPDGMPVARVGDTATARLDVTDRTIEAYAELVGDDNPLHLDEEYAAEGVFDGRVAHGLLAAGAVSAALADLPGDVVYVSQELSFEAPVRPGDTVTATVEVRERLEGDRLRVRTVARVDDQRVLDGEATVLSVSHEG
jgi:3-hydroxybutyryl-CoA dehydratase